VRLSSVKSRQDCSPVIGVNLGKNKNSADPVNDYVMGVKKLEGGGCLYLAINISSSNTPGLRSEVNARQKCVEESLESCDRCQKWFT
jgi:dihydroorotate dehydrogenase